MGLNRNFLRTLTIGSMFSGSVLANAVPTKVVGKVLGFGQLRSDDIVDGAVVIPSLKAQDILSFQLNSLLGPNEEMSAGPVTTEVPGNLYIPSQRERYGIFPITLNKETFTLMMEPGERNELVAIRFQAPFSRAVELARNKAPYTELVPLVTLKSFSLGSDRDWSREPSVNLTLDKDFQKTSNYQWRRNPAAANEFDMLVSFQRSPKDRWIPTDLIGKLPASGKFNISPSLPNDLKVLTARVTNNVDNDPVEARGWFLNGKGGDTFSAADLPEKISGISIKDNTIQWNPIDTHGWMAVLRGSKMKSAPEVPEGLSGDLMVLGDFGIGKLLRFLGDSPLENWISAKEGIYELATPRLANEKISLLFIGAHREVPNPQDSELTEPELFTYAKELRMVVIQ